MPNGKLQHDEPDLDVWGTVIPPLTILQAGINHEFPVHVKHGDDVVVTATQVRGPAIETAPVTSTATRELEQLDIWHEPQEVDGELRGRATFQWPADAGAGYWRVEVTSDTYSEMGLVLLVPAHGDATTGWGVSIDLPATRSSRSWGVGDLADLGELAVLAARRGADFAFARPQTLREMRFEGESLAPAGFISPITRARYLPASLLRVEEIPELAYVPAPDRALIEWEAEEFESINSSSDPLNIELASQAKSSALDLIQAVELTAARRAEFDAYVGAQGPEFEHFALWAAIAESCHREGKEWPEDAETPDSFGARRAGDQLEEQIEKHKRYQWQISEQFARAHARARNAGMKIGLMRAAFWHPEGKDLEANVNWFTAVSAQCGALRITPSTDEPDAAALAVLAIEANTSGIELVLSANKNSQWHETAAVFGVATQTRPWRVDGEQIRINSDDFEFNQLLEVKTPLDIPLANFLADEFAQHLPDHLSDSQREEVRRGARNVHDLLVRELANAGLIDDEVSSRGLMEALHVWAVQQKPRLTVLRLRDLMGQRTWGGRNTARRQPLLDAFDVPVVIDDVPGAPTLLSLLRRFEIM